MDSRILDLFPSKTVLVLGDVMLDKYVWGGVSRISPEAPVPIVEVHQESYAPGGAANAAGNVAALGGKAVLVGLVGNDGHRGILLRQLEQHGIHAQLVLDERPTITKMRVMGHRQQLIRVDYEQKHPVDKATEQRILNTVQATPADAVIVSDYAKGLITQSLYNAVKQSCEERGIPLFVDVKPHRAISYAGATVIKTNHKEACMLAAVEEHNGDGMDTIGRQLVQKLGSHVLVTRGEKGVSIFSNKGNITHVPTKAQQVFDVTGAGDTFLAAFALAFTSGASLEDAAIVANHAAGIKVGKVGTATVSADELRKDLQ
jgi:D-beta-D-heptose 7-phosphate kinase/D-beta-D-heptose 1-phosphate adenosyltransferase